jgi:hypothetical protein
MLPKVSTGKHQRKERRAEFIHRLTLNGAALGGQGFPMLEA